MSEPNSDPRFTTGLLIDVRAALMKHGYNPSADPKSHADVLVDLLQLTRHFEGRE